MITDNALVVLAKQAKENSYSPYSNFSVGAALLCEDGSVFFGCNIENAAFSETICAERVALFSAISQGARLFSHIAIAADSDGFCMPCGACRQVLYEHAPNLTILCARADGVFQKYTLRDLLPIAFTLE